MVDFINKLIKFPKVNIEVRPIQLLYKTELSQILLCEETKTKTKLCIKSILCKENDKDQLNSIMTEIFLLKKLRNKNNIVQMYDLTSFQINNCIYYLILMEYCKYQTLLKYIDKNQILDDTKIFNIIFQIAQGLKALHELGYYHRDLCPENILLRNLNDKYIELAICDFGSATNQIYSNEKIKSMNNNNSIIDLLFDLYSKTNLKYRAPEEIIINSNQPITEKVDIFALGIISVMLLLSYIPPPYFNFQLLLHSTKKVRVKIISTIYVLCNPIFTKLLDSIFSTDTSERFKIDEVLNFLALNGNRIKQINPEDDRKKEKIFFYQTYHKTLYEFEEQDMSNNEFSIKILTRRILHGKFLNEEGIFEVPDFSYINIIIDMIKQEPQQVIEFYTNLFSTNVFFYNIFSLKFSLNLHYFVLNFNYKENNKFPNNIEMICPKEMDIFKQLDNFINFLNMKKNKNYNSKDEFMKDINISKFIVEYIQFIKKKILLLKNNQQLISNDNTINIRNYNEFLSQNFIFDIWYLFYLSHQILIKIPLYNKIILRILDSISYLLNQEIVSLCAILFIQLVFLKKQNKNFDFFSKFIDIVEKASKFFKDLEKNRKEINSKYKVIYFVEGDNPDKKLKSLINFINEINYDPNFDVTKCIKLDSNFWKKFDFIPIKITNGNKKKFIENDNKINSFNENTLDDFNKNFFSRSEENEEKNFDLKINKDNQSNLNDFSSTFSLSNISNSNYSKNKKSINKNKLSQKNKNNNSALEDITEFLISEFSKPLYHFIIQHNYLKISSKLIGLGATSEVYLGNYKGLDVAVKKIKIKEINDNFYKEYQNEISILTAVNHPNLVIFLGTMIEDNYLCIITEYCEGGTLYDLLYKKNNIEISWNLKLNFLIQISEAMIFLHKNEPKIIHRDLKSLNILLTSQIIKNNSNEHIKIKISDFGLSQIISKDIKNSGLNGVGSVQWMAPEILQNNNSENFDEKVDVYSFGIIIWEIYARIQPYKDMNVSQIINYVCNEDGRPNCDLIKIEELPKGILKLMKKCWDKDPNARPDFEEILQILNDIKSFGE